MSFSDGDFMKHLMVAALASAIAATPASAALVLTLQQATPGAIALGSTAVFNLTIASDSGTTQVAGVSFTITIGVDFSGIVIGGGQFSAGTNDLFGPNGGFGFPFPTSMQDFAANVGSNLALDTTAALLATLTLDTAGATVGVHSMRLTNFGAVDDSYFPLAMSIITPGLDGTLRYEIVAAPVVSVPEPGSAALVGLAMATVFSLRRRPSTNRC